MARLLAILLCAATLAPAATLNFPTEIWRMGGEDGELLASVTSVVEAGGELFVLDSRLSTIHVHDLATGEPRRTIVTDGEGPGELTRPRQLVAVDDATLGLVASGVVPELVTITPEGLPSTVFGTDRLRFCTGARDMFVMNRVEACAGGFVVAGDDHVLFLRRYDANGMVRAVYVETPTRSDLARRIWDDRDLYLARNAPWCVADGHVYVAPDRNGFDHYELQVFDLAGDLVQVARRPFASVRRDAAQRMAAVHASLGGPDGLRRLAAIGGEFVCAEHVADVARLVPRPDGSVWIETSRSDDEPGCVVYDRFRLGEGFDRCRVRYPDHSPRDERYFVDDRLVVVKGRYDLGPGEPGDDAEALTLIVYGREAVP